MKRKNKNSKGFSLTELLIVLSIVSMLAVVSFVGLSSNRKNTRLKLSQRTVAAAIKMAQSYAVQGKTQSIDVTNTNDIVPCGYGMVFTSENHFVIFYNKPLDSSSVDCQMINSDQDYYNAANFRYNTAATANVAASEIIQEYDLEQEIVLKDFDSGDPDNTRIYFSTAFAGKYNSGNTYVLQLKGEPDETRSITVNSVGSVSED